MWVRGLKRYILLGQVDTTAVAPHVGAWIETNHNVRQVSLLGRTPCGCVD